MWKSKKVAVSPALLAENLRNSSAELSEILRSQSWKGISSSRLRFGSIDDDVALVAEPVAAIGHGELPVRCDYNALPIQLPLQSLVSLEIGNHGRRGIVMRVAIEQLQVAPARDIFGAPESRPAAGTNCAHMEPVHRSPGGVADLPGGSTCPRPLRGPLFTTTTCGLMAPRKGGDPAPSSEPWRLV